MILEKCSNCARHFLNSQHLLPSFLTFYIQSVSPRIERRLQTVVVLEIQAKQNTINFDTE